MTAEDLIYSSTITADPYDPPIKIGTMHLRIERIRKDKDWIIFYAVEERVTPVIGPTEYIEHPERQKIEVNAGKAGAEARKWLELIRHDWKGVGLDLDLFRTPSGKYMQALYLTIGSKRVFVARTPLTSLEDLKEAG